MRHSFKVAILTAVYLFSAVDAQTTRPATSPEYRKFSRALPIPEVLAPKARTTYNGTPMEYYEITTEKVVRNGLFNENSVTNLLGYNGQVPGPTFRIKRGTETVVRMINKDTDNKVLHLHGAYSRAPFDGWAEDFVRPNQYKDYYYPNKQSARTLFYHDHTNDHTATQVRKGLAGFYIIEDDEQDEKLKLPKGDFDVPLMLSSLVYSATGDVTNTGGGNHGDTITVNGEPWPYLEVEPRKYRLRLLNGSPLRTFKLKFTADDTDKTNLKMKVIAGDAGYASQVIETPDIIIGMAERYEVVVDFAGFRGKNVTLENLPLGNPFAEGDFTRGDEVITRNVMQFRVKDLGEDEIDNTNNGNVDFSQVEKFPVIPKKPQSDETYELQNAGGGRFVIKGRFFNDGKNRVLRNVPRGTIEQWTIRTEGAGGNLHPLHVHLIEFQVVDRRAIASGLNARSHVEEYERYVQKDTVSVAGGEEVDIIAVYAPWSGVYMFHCHNLGHEDAGMMMAFDVKSLPDLGYPDSTIAMENPMKEEFLAKNGGSISADEARDEILPYFGALNAYVNPEEVYTKLKQYHATKIPTPTGSAAHPSATDGHYYTPAPVPRRARRSFRA